MKNDAPPDYSVRSVDIVLDILELMIKSDTTQVTMTGICSALRISRSKAYRFLLTLEKRGIVAKDAQSGNYQLGINAVRLSQKILNGTNLITHSHPIIKDLARKHDEAVYMTVLKDDEVVFLDMADCDQTVKAEALIGRSFPFFSNAAGKVIRALESRDIEKIFKKRRKTPCDFNLLESELEEIRKNGVAVDFNGLGEGIISVAVAVKDYAGKVVGAITMLVPSFRMLSERLEHEIIPSLIEGADMLSLKFGYAKY